MTIFEPTELFIIHYALFFIETLTHSILTAKQFYLYFLQIFWIIFQFLKPKHDCYIKFKSCFT